MALACARRSRRVRPVRRRLQPDEHLLHPRPHDVLLAAASLDPPFAHGRLLASVGSLCRGGPGGVFRRAESVVPAAGPAVASAPGRSRLQPAGRGAVSPCGAWHVALSPASRLRNERGVGRHRVFRQRTRCVDRQLPEPFLVRGLDPVDRVGRGSRSRGARRARLRAPDGADRVSDALRRAGDDGRDHRAARRIRPRVRGSGRVGPRACPSGRASRRSDCGGGRDLDSSVGADGACGTRVAARSDAYRQLLVDPPALARGVGAAARVR